MTLDPAFVYSNYVEAGLWILMGATALFKTRRRATGWVLGISLVLFGVSDIVESRTGAWYRPWWLFAWKAACVLATLIGGVTLLRERRHASPP